MTTATILTLLFGTVLPAVASSVLTHMAMNRATTPATPSLPALPATGPLGGQFLPNHPLLMNLWQALVAAAPLLVPPVNVVGPDVLHTAPAQPVDYIALVQMFLSHMQAQAAAQAANAPPAAPPVAPLVPKV